MNSKQAYLRENCRAVQNECTEEVFANLERNRRSNYHRTGNAGSESENLRKHEVARETQGESIVRRSKFENGNSVIYDIIVVNSDG